MAAILTATDEEVIIGQSFSLVNTWRN